MFCNGTKNVPNKCYPLLRIYLHRLYVTIEQTIEKAVTLYIYYDLNGSSMGRKRSSVMQGISRYCT